MPKPATESKKALIVVRTYPTPAKKGVEVSCTAAITENGQWLRLFPVPWRFLEEDQRFRKYQWVNVKVVKATDVRPESYKLIPGSSIEILTAPLPTAHAWQARKKIVTPLQSHCLCCLKRERDEKGFPTLGFFKPRSIEGLGMEPEDPNWSEAQSAILRQGDLFAKEPTEMLEKVPFSFRYRFHCDEDDCSGHNMLCTDWEMGQSWRKWKNEYGEKWEAKFRQRYETDMVMKYDTHFYAGTVHQYPSTWILVGLFYPPRQEQQELFDV